MGLQVVPACSRNDPYSRNLTLPDQIGRYYWVCLIGRSGHGNA
jgi:hypothetical protein